MRCFVAVLFVTVLAFSGTCAFADSINGAVNPDGDDPPLPLTGVWQYFSWDSDTDPFNQEGPWTFTSSQAVTLDVTDTYIDGDRFKVYDFGTLVGTTSAPTDTGTQIGDNADAAFADSDWSSGSFLLAAGSHSITLQTIEKATGYSTGAAYLRASPAPVPEPATLLLLGAGLAGLGAVRRRRQRAL